jgi:nitroreductase
MSEPGPDEATLRAMLTLAARVPDHGKLVPWRFIVMGGDSRRAAGEAIARVAEETGRACDLEEERGRFLRAPLVVAVVSRAAPHPKIPEWEQVLSAGAVCLNLVHAAAAHGFAANWLTEWMAYDAKARAVLGLAEAERVAGFVHIGASDVKPADRDRPELDAIVQVYDPAVAA